MTCGLPVGSDIVEMTLKAVGADQLEVTPHPSLSLRERVRVRAVDVRILRAAKTQLIHEEVRDFFFEDGVLDRAEVFLRWHRPFVAFLKYGFDAVLFHE